MRVNRRHVLRPAMPLKWLLAGCCLASATPIADETVLLQQGLRDPEIGREENSIDHDVSPEPRSQAGVEKPHSPDFGRYMRDAVASRAREYMARSVDSNFNRMMDYLESFTDGRAYNDGKTFEESKNSTEDAYIEPTTMVCDGLDGYDVERALRHRGHHSMEGGATPHQFAIMANLAQLTNASVICETGFNYGISAIAFLCGSTNKSAKVYSFDLASHEYVDTAVDFVQNSFGKSRLKLVKGNSRDTLAAAVLNGGVEKGESCDISYVDGGTSFQTSFKDIFHFGQLSKPGSRIAVENCNYEGIHRPPGGISTVSEAYKYAVSRGIVDHAYQVSDGCDDKKHPMSCREMCVGCFGKCGGNVKRPEKTIGEAVRSLTDNFGVVTEQAPIEEKEIALDELPPMPYQPTEADPLSLSDELLKVAKEDEVAVLPGGFARSESAADLEKLANDPEVPRQEEQEISEREEKEAESYNWPSAWPDKAKTNVNLREEQTEDHAEDLHEEEARSHALDMEELTEEDVPGASAPLNPVEAAKAAAKAANAAAAAAEQARKAAEQASLAAATWQEAQSPLEH